ncbi:hypothetical protein [Coralloluteibacterium stylophorae]|uniref:Uncharacterized protein n=1 Tax=Coralloluteibacterium stylophorae TaxID=1776034 RepID=A0A8J7VR97_9GAMM|nr:hypothetical protein [Coralloluteibacterium stylophorae]MBS7457681.1 hypothetical protein [Coralloluteibacterium stylophorae]
MGGDALTAVSRRLVRQTKYRARKRGIEFDLTHEDVPIPACCPVLGIPLYRAIGAKAQGPNSPSLDRIDPNRGYVRGNVLVVSSKANSIKNNATPRELLQVACFYQEHLNQP